MQNEWVEFVQNWLQLVQIEQQLFDFSESVFIDWWFKFNFTRIKNQILSKSKNQIKIMAKVSKTKMNSISKV